MCACEVQYRINCSPTTGVISNMDAEKLNVHYAAISTDKQYQPPAMKQTVNRTVEHLTEGQT